MRTTYDFLEPVFITSVEAPVSRIDFKIYPNPAMHEVRAAVELEKAQEVTIELFDVIGQRIFSSEVFLESGSNEMEVPVSQLTNGTYMVRLSTENQQVTKRLIIHKLRA